MADIVLKKMLAFPQQSLIAQTCKILRYGFINDEQELSSLELLFTSHLFVPRCVLA